MLAIHLQTILTEVYCNRSNIFWTSVVYWGGKKTPRIFSVLREVFLCHYPPVIGSPTERAGFCRCSVETFRVFGAHHSTLSLSPFHLKTETNGCDFLTWHDGKCPKCQSCVLWYCFCSNPLSFIFISVLSAVKMVGPLNFEVGFQVGFTNVCKFWWAFMIITVGCLHRQLAYRQEYERSWGWREQMCV